MTALHLAVTDTGEDQPLASVLRTAHNIWIRETALFLSSAIKPDAGFWERWTAVRCLAEQFQRPFHRDRALVNEMQPFLPAETGDRLFREGERVAQLGQALDEIGRRRGTARTVAVASREFLQLLRQWCCDIELAAEQIPRDALPQATARLVDEFEIYVRMH